MRFHAFALSRGGKDGAPVDRGTFDASTCHAARTLGSGSFYLSLTTRLLLDQSAFTKNHPLVAAVPLPGKGFVKLNACLDSHV